LILMSFLERGKISNEQGQFEEVKLLILIFVVFGIVLPLLIKATGDTYNIAPYIPIIMALLLTSIGISRRK